MEPLIAERGGRRPPPKPFSPPFRPSGSRVVRAADPMPGSAYGLLLGLLLVATLALRLWGIKQGLPYSYNVDEATHFVPRAMGFFSHDLDPHYFLNPPAYSYLVAAALELWFGSADAAMRAYTVDPTGVFVVARVVAALLGTAAVWLTCLAGTRLFSRAVGLLGAAVFGLAFLPIFYSHLALNDVPVLAPLALSLYGAAGVYRYGRLRDYLLAGAGIGLASATKYTGGITLICLLAAAGCDAGSGGGRRAALHLGAGLALALGMFTLANPYWVLDFPAFTHGLGSQASRAGGSGPEKLGTPSGGGILYYLWTFTWGLGVVPSVAAALGALLLALRRAWGLFAILVPAPVAYILFMGVQQRFFGRWLMPIFPVVALLGAVAAVELVGWLGSRLPIGRGPQLAARRAPVGWLAPLLGALAAAGLLAQSVVADVHDDAVLSRPDTRNLTRAWMVQHIPAGSKVVVEPVVPSDWTSDIGRSLPAGPAGERWHEYQTWFSRRSASGRLLPGGRRRYVVVDEYERVLAPALLPGYVRQGYCWVVVGSLQSGRALAHPHQVPQAIAYYRALARRGRLMYRISPFSPGARPVAFSFDFSIDYYPEAYRLPGPVMSVYRLRGHGCHR